ncbi:MAG: 50S ribosomal protein L21 [Hyphomicrobiales bacterium]|nr:MAG: 50S ribosomal protein L21 [Hyphomicrobiales bacterium]
MFAVIRTGGKQYKVSQGDVIRVEKLAGDAGDQIQIDDVLMLGGEGEPQLGTPLVDGASVAAEILEQTRAAKITVFKKKRRKNYRRKKGHRQHLTCLKVTDILTGGAKPKKAAKPKAEKPKAEAAPKPAKDEAAPAALFTAPEGPADDLKKISGVGPVLEKKLNALGITTYAQVAAFSPEDIAKVDDALSFKGRIDRDDWLGQASKLAAEAK